MKSKTVSIVVTSGGELLGRGLKEPAEDVLVVDCMDIYICRYACMCTYV